MHVHHPPLHGLPAPGTDHRPIRRAYRISISLNLAFVILEFMIGRASHSLGLVSDAGHKLLDVFALGIALVGFRLTSRPSADARRISALIALINTLILLFAVGDIIYESIGKLAAPEPVDGAAISWVAGIGLIVSGCSAWLLMRHQNDINTRAAFLHMATDSLLSLGIVIAGIVIKRTGLHVLDPAISLFVAAIILFNTLRLLLDAVRMLSRP
jgi:Co/Zn/Cd efflux system component